MWKKAFVALLSLNLLVLVGFTMWWGMLPKADTVQQKVDKLASQDKTATIQLAIGEDAINTYLEYAISEQKDIQGVLSYVRVHFDADWQLQVGIKLSNRVVPCDIVMAPRVQNGNLYLQVKSASMGEIPVPPSALFFVFKHLPWPNWITVDPDTYTINLLFTQRPQQPYGIEILDYSTSTKLVTLRVSIVPKSLLNK
jgi:uncharacterized protein YpmS